MSPADTRLTIVNSPQQDNKATKNIMIMTTMRLVAVLMLMTQLCSAGTNRIFRDVDPSTREFIEEHCGSHEVIRRSQGTSSPFTDVRFHCNDISAATIEMRQCETRCVNPVTSERLKKLRNQSVVLTMLVVDRHGNRKALRIPKACHCVTLSGHVAKKECKRQHFHRRRTER